MKKGNEKTDHVITVFRFNLFPKIASIYYSILALISLITTIIVFLAVVARK